MPKYLILIIINIVHLHLDYFRILIQLMIQNYMLIHQLSLPFHFMQEKRPKMFHLIILSIDLVLIFVSYLILWPPLQTYKMIKASILSFLISLVKVMELIQMAYSFIVLILTQIANYFINDDIVIPPFN